MEKHKISIIVPVYNTESYIGRCIESVLNQPYTEWEMILVDDCGYDNSMDIVREYAAKDCRIRYVESASNAGPMVAREKGYKLATGKYVFFLDSDDTIPNNALDNMINAANNSGSDIIMGQMERVWEDGRHSPFEINVTNGKKSTDEVYRLLLNNTFPHNLCGKLFRSHLFNDNYLENYDNLKNGEDGFLFLQLLEHANNVYVIEDTVYHYWCYSNSSTHRPYTPEMINGIVMFERYRHDVLTRHLGNVEIQYYDYLHTMLSEIAMRYPYSELEDAFNGQQLYLNFSLLKMMKFMTFKKSLKVYIKAKIIGRYNTMVGNYC